MSKIFARKKFLLATILIIVAYLASIASVGFGFFATGGLEDIEPGMPSPRRFQAPRQIINFYAFENAKDEAAAAVPVQLSLDTEISGWVLLELEEFFVEVGVLRAEYLPIRTPFGEHGIFVQEERPLPDISGLLLILDEEQARHIITGDSPTFARFMAEVTQMFEENLEDGISGSLLPYALAVADGLRQQGFDEIYASIGQVVATDFLRPNMVVNEEATEDLRQQARDAVQPTYYYAQQNIVQEGDIITEEAYRALIELGLVGGDGLALAGAFGGLLAVTTTFVVMVLYIFLFMKGMAENRRRLLLLFTLYIVTIILARIMVPLDYFLTPIMLFAMLVSILIDMRLAMVLTVGVAVITAAMNPPDSIFLNYAIVNGVFAAMIAKQAVARGRLVVAVASLGLVNVLMVSANYLLFGAGFSMDMVNYAIFALLGGFITVLLCVGTLPFWESIFEVVTQNNLVELTNPNNALLKRMIIETPGTYHHSLVVANLSETACYDIGANHALARAGAYYHDIGKIQYPQYFAENQSGVNPHDSLPPRTSVEVIADHITRGMELAKQYKLPLPIRSFIEEHHGTTLTKVFYHKEKTENPDIEIDEQDFRYKNRIPQSPESAVVMLADTCEAAVRSIMTKGGKNIEEMDGVVRGLIKDKLEDGQLDDSGLSIKDLDTIARAFMRVFKGMYHERVPYPGGSVKELVRTPAAAEEAVDKMEDEGIVYEDGELGDSDRK